MISLQFLEKLDKDADILVIEEIMSVKDTLRAFRIVKGYLEDAKGRLSTSPSIGREDSVVS